MDLIGRWIVGAVMGVVALVGLFLASRAVDGVFYWFGIGLTVFGLAFVFVLVKRTFDEADARRSGGPTPEGR